MKRFSAKVIVLAMMTIFVAVQAHAQFLGYASPQTVQAILANGASCTGSEQDFTTGDVSIPKFTNLGQNQHFVSATSPSTVTTFQMVIQGIDNQGNVLNISDVGTINGSIPASGYFPKIRVAVTCTPAVTGTFTLNYSGTSAASPVDAGSFLSSQLDKLLIRNAAGGRTIGPNSTPFGSSSGRLLFQFISAAEAGDTLTVTCEGSTVIGGYNSLQFPLANNTFVQSFNVPATQCPNYFVGYGPGAVGVPVLAEYVFDPPGLVPAATQQNGCQIQSFNRSTTAPITVGANTTVQIIGPVVTSRVAVCSLVLTAGVAGTAQLIEGTGGTCGTGSANLSGAITLAVGTPLVLSGSLPTFNTITTGDGVCITTAGGATVAGLVSFIYAPI